MSPRRAGDDLLFRLLVGAGIAAGVGILLGGGGLLLAAARLESSLETTALVEAFQQVFVLATYCGGLTCLAAVLAILTKTWKNAVERLDRLEAEHATLLKKFRKRTPTLVAGLVLAGQAVLIVTDETFDGMSFAKIGVSFVLLLIFALANQLLCQEGRGRRIVGSLLWAIGVVALPATVLAAKGLTLPESVEGLREFGAWNLALLALCFLCLTFLPFATRWAGLRGEPTA